MVGLSNYLEMARRHLEVAERLKMDLRDTSPNDAELVETRMAVHHLLLAVERLSKDSPRTTAEPTPTAPIEDSQWDAPEQVTITPTPSPSQSVTAEGSSGPAAASSACAHFWAHSTEVQGLEYCRMYNCDALKLGGRILVPAAPTTSSTSASEPLKKSADPTSEESAKFLSRNCPECESDITHGGHRWQAISTVRGYDNLYWCNGWTGY